VHPRHPDACDLGDIANDEPLELDERHWLTAWRQQTSSLPFPIRGPLASRQQWNYFFEWCVWIGYAVAGFAYAPLGLIALAPQAIILASIFGITGILPTENQAIRSKGDAYRAYQKRVSKFVPLPPKARGADT
jgi:hypothetical protein